jgi:multidrug efflux pump subunit AcrA (membrane-fusion protein)
VAQSLTMSFTLSRISVRTAVIGAVALVVVVGGVSTVWALSGTSKPTKAKATTAVTKIGTVTTSASAAGSVEPIDQQALTFGTDGTVSTLKIKAGDMVYSGETLATLDQSDAQSAVDSAQSALDAADDNLDLAQQQADDPTPTPTMCPNGQPAAFKVAHTLPAPSTAPTVPGQPTPTPTPTPTVRPTQTPTAPGTPTPSHLPTGIPTHPNPVPVPTGGCIPHGSGGGGQQTQNTGTDNLLRAEQTDNNDELALEQAQQKLDGTTITAPVDGKVLEVNGKVGDDVQAGGSGFIIIGGSSSLVVQASFSEADVAAIKNGQSATVSLANHPGTTYKAKVTQIDPAGTTSGSLVKYGVQLSFTSVPTNLLLGQTADVVVTTSSVSDAVYVPASAVTSGPNGVSQVTVRTSTGDEVHSVVTGLDGDQGVEIKSGLSAGQTVVLQH